MPSSGPDPRGAGGVVPRRAPVTPRVRTDKGEATLSLEHHIRGLLAAGAFELVNLYGPPGSGKSVALEHIAELFKGDERLKIIDENRLVHPSRAWNGSLVLFTSRQRTASWFLNLEMAPWTDDDLIEYLANTHRGRVGVVMQRVAHSQDRDELQGLPEPWRIVLDVLAADDGITDIWSALRWHLGLEFPEETVRQWARQFSLCSLSELSEQDIATRPSPRLDDFGPRVRRMMRYRCVLLPLAAESVLASLCAGQHGPMRGKLPHDLLRQTAALARSNPAAVQSLRIMSRQGPAHARAASMLHAMNIGWRPEPRSLPNLTHAELSGAQWPGIDLPDCIAVSVHLAGAFLPGANLTRATVSEGDFSGTCLKGAMLQKLRAGGVNFTGADLSSVEAVRADFDSATFDRANLSDANLCDANLHGAHLRGATLSSANLSGATLERSNIIGADFTNANLAAAKLRRLDLRSATFTNVCFSAAEMTLCNLEYGNYPAAKFNNAKLNGALLTGTVMPRADFRMANLRKAGVADVDWEGADLRGADLRGASFHAGSTRSGLVGSCIPSEGSRTGFYTDDFNDRDFKSPEEIRKANLRGADLRGAKIKNVDFYLVDLRDARFSPKQRKWFKRCGAILSG